MAKQAHNLPRRQADPAPAPALDELFGASDETPRGGVVHVDLPAGAVPEPLLNDLQVDLDETIIEPAVVIPQRDTLEADGWSRLPASPPEGRYGEHPFNHGPVVLLAPDGSAVEAQWTITTRQMNRRWRPHGYWAKRFGGGVGVGFEPLGYRRVE